VLDPTVRSSRYAALVPLLLAVVLVTAACGCSSDIQPEPDVVAKDCAGADRTAPAPEVGPADSVAEDLRTADIAPPPEEIAADVPIVPQPAAPKKYSGGACPTLVGGKNTLKMGGLMRSVELFLPPHPAPGASVVFVWHGNGDTPKNIAMFFGADTLTKENNLIMVSPYSCCDENHTDCCDMTTTWNFGKYSKNDKDLAVFDDVLSCLEQQGDIDNTRVYTIGFSAGALWSTYLVLHRAEYLAAAGVFSGGTGMVIPYSKPGYPVPALLAWGGTKDTYMNMIMFDTMMNEFSDKLAADGHFVIECNHGLGHTVPYGVTPWLSKFLLAHAWKDGSSPFAQTGLGDDFPDYCLIP